MMWGWRTEKLGNICQFENGDRGKNYPGRKSCVNKGVPFINAGHLTDQGIDFDSMNFIPEEKFNLLSQGKTKEGDLLFCLRGSLGKYSIVKGIEKGAIASSLVIVRPGSKLDKHFLALYFGGSPCREMIEKYGNGAAQPNLSVKSLKQFEIPLPPLYEQKRIVAILDEAFAGLETAVANTEKNLANARELFESYQSKVFTEKGQGWITKPLGECFRLKSGDGLTKKAMVAGEFPVFGGNGIAGTHNAYNLAGDNVIIGRVGALCGNARHIIESVWLTDNAFKVIDKKYNIDNAFLTYLLNCKNLRKYARQSAQPVISNSSLKDILIDFPEAEAVQKKIVEKLNEIRSECGRLEDICKNKMDSLFELKQSLLQKAFSGELTANLDSAVKEVAA